MRTNILRQWLQLDLNAVLDILHTAQRQLQRFYQVKCLVPRNQLQPFARLRVVDAAIDGHEHERVGVADVVEAGLDGAEGFFDGSDAAVALDDVGMALVECILDYVDTGGERRQRLDKKQKENVSIQ